MIFLYAEKPVKSKRYLISNVPDHVYLKIVKLNDVKFRPKQLVLEEAKTKHKDRAPDKQNSPDHQFTNYCLNIIHEHEQRQGHQHLQQQQRQQQQQQQLQQQHQHQQQHKLYNHQKQHQRIQQPQQQQQQH